MEHYSSTEHNGTGEDSSIDFTIQYENGGPVLAVILSVLLLLKLTANSFIVIYTVLHPTSLKKESSTVGLAAINLSISNVSLVPIVTSAAEEWIFGKTVAEKEAVCKLNGYIALSNFNLQYGMLAIISIDRLFKIVKPLLHKQYFNPKQAATAMVALWTVLALLATTPFYQKKGFHFYAALCFCSTSSTIHYVIVAPLVTITSIWTCLFTGNFLKNDHILHQNFTPSDRDRKENDHIYKEKVCKMFGIVSLMLILHLVASVSTIIVGILVSTRKTQIALPRAVYILSSTLLGICIPLIQCYFRKDLWEAICYSVTAVGRCIQCKFHQEPATKEAVHQPATTETSSTV